jgi:hypothetical protein
MRTISALSLLAVVSLVGCGVQPLSHDDNVTRAAARDTCTLDVPSRLDTVLAHDDGVAVATDGLVQRMHGAGCDLTPWGAPVAAHALLDVDDAGNLYVFPAEAPTGAAHGAGAVAGAIGTMLDGEYPESMVARVDAHATSTDDVYKLLDAGRGIWGFGVSPAGDALWSIACGPSGVFDVTSDGVTSSSLAAPVNAGGVLTGAGTFWSVAAPTCTSPVQGGCAAALVRSTLEGDVDVGTTTIDFGEGVEQGALARCGERVCAVFPNGVVVWDDAGAIVRQLTRDDLTASNELIAAVTGNRHGLYVTLRGIRCGQARVVFVPLR